MSDSTTERGQGVGFCLDMERPRPKQHSKQSAVLVDGMLHEVYARLWKPGVDQPHAAQSL